MTNIQQRFLGTIPYNVHPDTRLRLLVKAGTNATVADSFVDWTEHHYIVKPAVTDEEIADLWLRFIIDSQTVTE